MLTLITGSNVRGYQFPPPGVSGVRPRHARATPAPRLTLSLGSCGHFLTKISQWRLACRRSFPRQVAHSPAAQPSVPAARLSEQARGERDVIVRRGPRLAGPRPV
eukprot:gene12945-biopygen7922